MHEKEESWRESSEKGMGKCNFPQSRSVTKGWRKEHMEDTCGKPKTKLGAKKERANVA